MVQRSYDDLLKFQEMYGLSPDKTAKAFGVELPPPVVDAPISPVAPMDLGGTLPPAHPGMLSDPGNLARNGPRQPAQQAEINLDQQPEINIDNVPATGIPLAPKKTLWQDIKQAGKDVGGVALDILSPKGAEETSKTVDLTYKPDGDWRNVPGQPKKEETSPEVANQKDLLASMGGGQPEQGAAPAVKLSPEQRMQMAMTKLGYNANEYANAQDKSIDASEMALRSRAVAQQGTQDLSQFYTDTAKATADFYKEIEGERARTAQQEQADRQAVTTKSEDILAKSEPSATTKIGQMIAYAMAGFGNAMSVRHGGQATDIVNQMIARDDQSAERSYQKALQTVERLKVDQATKDKMRRQAILDRTASFVASRSAVMDQLNGLTQANKGKFEGAQIDELRAQNDALRAEKDMKLNMGLRQAAESIPSVIGGGPTSRVAKVDSDELVQDGNAPDGTPLYFRARGGAKVAGELRGKIGSSRTLVNQLESAANELDAQAAVSPDLWQGKDEAWDQKMDTLTLTAKAGLNGMNSDKDFDLLRRSQGGGARPVLGFKANQMAARLRSMAAKEQKAIDDAKLVYGDEGFAQVVDPRTGRPVHLSIGPVRNTKQVAPVTGNKPKVP